MKKTKAEWPAGPWHSEPDEKSWEDRDTGLACRAMRGPTGAWCGYVGVREGHPAHGCHYHVSDYSFDDVAAGISTTRINVQAQVNEITAHGGLTYAGDHRKLSGGRWWFGFDCAHAGDYSPAYDDFKQLGSPTGWGGVVEYRDLAYVEKECADLARQLGAVDPRKKPTLEKK